MIRKNICFAAIICLVFAGIVKGQNKTSLIKPSDIVITGTLIDSAILTTESKKQTLGLQVAIMASSWNEVPVEYTKFNLRYLENFQHILQPTSEYTYVGISLEKLPGKQNWNDRDNMYIFEKGDRVNCKLSNDYYEFTGKGSEKLNCQSELYKIMYKPDEYDTNLLKARKYAEFFKNEERKRDSILKLQIAIVKKYAPKLGKKMAEIMIANCYGLRYYAQFFRQRMNMSFVGGSEEVKAFLAQENYRKMNLTVPEKIHEEALIAAPVYGNAVSYKLFLDNLSDQNGELRKSGSKEVLEGIYRDLISNYKGLLREKLLLLFFYRMKGDAAMNKIDSALTYITRPEYREALLKIKQTRAKGQPFLPFALEDTKGKIVKLSDFASDEVVILDFWYTGCAWCGLLYEGMKPIVEKYKDNPKVKFVTISIDEDKARWKKSVADAKYTDPAHINLYTGGSGFNHPVIKENQITGYPTVFILKNGKIFTASPPRPTSGTTAGNDKVRAAYISLVEDALRVKL